MIPTKSKDSITNTLVILSDELSKCEYVSNIGGIGAMFAFQVFDGTMMSL